MALVRSVPASSCAMRSSATSTYSSVISQPYALRPFFKAATALDPTPRYGSNTFPPGFVILRTNLSTKPTGNWQGWSVFSTWFDFTLGISQTSDGFFPSGFPDNRSEEHTSELQSLMRISYAVFCLKKKKKHDKNTILECTKNIKC